MEKIIYRNSLNQELEFSSFSSFILRDITESTKNKIVTTNNSNVDGEVFNSSRLDIRDIKIKVTILHRSEVNRISLTKKLNSILNPHLPGKLIYRTEKKEKEIDVRLDEIPISKRGKGRTDFEIDFVALNPYWQNNPVTEYLALLSGRLTFPIVIPQNQGLIFGLRQSILESEVINIGDVATGFRVIFKSKGYVKNPEIENKFTGEKIKILVELQKDDILEIINSPQRKMLYLNAEKAFKYLDRNNADFFLLEVGNNKIAYNAEINAINLDVIMYYSPLFLGRD